MDVLITSGSVTFARAAGTASRIARDTTQRADECVDLMRLVGIGFHVCQKMGSTLKLLCENSKNVPQQLKLLSFLGRLRRD